MSYEVGEADKARIMAALQRHMDVRVRREGDSDVMWLREMTRGGGIKVTRIEFKRIPGGERDGRR